MVGRVVQGRGEERHDGAWRACRPSLRELIPCLGAHGVHLAAAGDGSEVVVHREASLEVGHEGVLHRHHGSGKGITRRVHCVVVEPLNERVALSRQWPKLLHVKDTVRGPVCANYMGEDGDNEQHEHADLTGIVDMDSLSTIGLDIDGCHLPQSVVEVER